MNRKQKLLDGLNLNQLTGMEIGPLFRPIVTKSEGNVIYIDHADSESLRNKYRNDPAVDITAIVDIDAVWGARTLRECLKNRTVDYVIASHVIEHVPDLITWLEELHSILKRRGELRLAVPDKRFTFDLIRRETELCDVLSAYLAHARVPQPICILDHLLNVSHVDPKRAWETELNAESVERCHSFAEAIQPARDALQNGAYHDVHCWTFTPRSFAALFESLALSGLVHFACDNFFDTERYEIEFFVTLKASDDQEQIVDSWAAMRSATKNFAPQHSASSDEALTGLLDFERTRNLALSKKLTVAQQTIQDLRDSTSWRVTAPLRSLASMVHRIVQRT